MVPLANFYFSREVFTLSEMRAGISTALIVCTYPFVYRACAQAGAVWAFPLYIAAVYGVLRRIASGLPFSLLSFDAWRRSPRNFRQTSRFKAAMIAKKRRIAGMVCGERPVAVLTGGERGIGYEVMSQLASEGFDVIACCPFEAEATRVLQRLEAQQLRGKLHFVPLNLAKEESVRECASAIHTMTGRVDLLINNAGMGLPSGVYKKNQRGQELVLSINFLGHALLTELLLDLVVRSGPSRIVFVSSLMHLNASVREGKGSPVKTLLAHCDPQQSYRTYNYSLSKLFMVCYMRDLARRLAQTQTAAVALHPGAVLTPIYGPWTKWMTPVLCTSYKFAAEGAEVVLFCALADEVRSGCFYADCKDYSSIISPLAMDDAENAALTDAVQRLYNLKNSTSSPSG